MPVLRKKSLLPPTSVRADAARMAAAPMTSARAPMGPRPVPRQTTATPQGAPQGARGMVYTTVDPGSDKAAPYDRSHVGGYFRDRYHDVPGGFREDETANDKAVSNRITDALQGARQGAGSGGMTNADIVPTGPSGTGGEQMQGVKTEEQLIAEAIREMMGEKADTSAEEKAIRDQMMIDVGQGQRALNGRLAAAGFGTSGALGAMSTDMRARAAREAADAIFDLRRQAEQDWLARATAGIGASQADERQDLAERRFEDEKNRAAAETASDQAIIDAENEANDQTDAAKARLYAADEESDHVGAGDTYVDSYTDENGVKWDVYEWGAGGPFASKYRVRAS